MSTVDPASAAPVPPADPFAGDWLARLARGWRGPAVAAAVAVLAGLPGVWAAPALDRDESRFAQATAQMLETRDFVSINYQDQPRDKKPVGIHWLQAASVALTSSAEDRGIWAYRLPSLLGAALAAAACAWGAAAAFGARTGVIAGAILGATLLLSTEAFIAKTDAVLCGLTTLAMAAFARLYLASRGAGAFAESAAQPGWRTPLLLWVGVGGAALVKGPVGPLVLLLAGLSLWAWDRRAPWLRRMQWVWGGVVVAALVGPWALAITVATDGAFWGAAIGGDLAPKLAGGHESHGAPFGLHTLLLPVLSFPATLLLPAAVALGWTRRREAGVRFAVCWLLPTVLMFELLPTKLVHYTLPAYGALAWLLAAALERPLQRWSRGAGALLALLAGAALAGVCVYGQREFGDPSDRPWTVLAAVLFVGAGLAGAALLWRRAAGRALGASLSLGVAAHGVLAAALLPRLEPLWVSREAARAVAAAGLDPRAGLVEGPVAAAGYAEPSLVFSLGTETELTDGAGAAQAIVEGRPALVEGRQAAAFAAAAEAAGVAPRAVAQVMGLDYSDGEDTTLTLYRPVPAPPPPEGAAP